MNPSLARVGKEYRASDCRWLATCRSRRLVLRGRTLVDWSSWNRTGGSPQTVERPVAYSSLRTLKVEIRKGYLCALVLYDLWISSETWRSSPLRELLKRNATLVPAVPESYSRSTPGRSQIVSPVSGNLQTRRWKVWDREWHAAYEVYHLGESSRGNECIHPILSGLMASQSMKHNGQVKWVADSPISGGPGIPSLFCQIIEAEVLFEPFLDCANFGRHFCQLVYAVCLLLRQSFFFSLVLRCSLLLLSLSTIGSACDSPLETAFG